MLWIGLWLPRLSLEVFERTLATSVTGSWRGPTGHPLVDGSCLAVCDRLQVLDANAAAIAHGVHAGQRRATALALCPELLVLGRDLAAERRALAQVACWALQFTPRISLREPSEDSADAGLLLDIEASLKLFDGLDRLLTRLRLGLQELGFSSNIGCAPTATASWLFARFRDGRIARTEAALDGLLADLPVGLLESLRSRAVAIEAIGARVFRDLVRLPRHGLARRFGKSLLLEMDMALGIQPEVLPWFDPPRHFEATLELAADVEEAESLVFAARRLLVQLSGWLAARQGAVRRLSIDARHDRTRRQPLPASTPIELRFALPGWQVDPMVAVLRERLALVALPAPVHTLSLRCDEIVDRPVRHASLLPEAHSAEEHLGRLVERLQARLGHEQVRRLELADDHRPEAAYRIRPLDELPRAQSPTPRSGPPPFAQPSPALPDGPKPRTPPRPRSAAVPSRTLPSRALSPHPLSSHPLSPRPLPSPASPISTADLGPTPRPLWLLEAPEPLAERQQRPWWRGPLRLLAGPERIEGGWWDGHFVERDYFIAESDQSQWVWIFRTRAGGGDHDAPPSHRWFLQGIFG